MLLVLMRLSAEVLLSEHRRTLQRDRTEVLLLLLLVLPVVAPLRLPFTLVRCSTITCRPRVQGTSYSSTARRLDRGAAAAPGGRRPQPPLNARVHRRPHFDGSAAPCAPPSLYLPIIRRWPCDTVHFLT